VSCGVLAGAGPVWNRAKVPPGASVAVFGCGGVGLNTIQAARLVGAAKIIAVDVLPKKLEWAQEFGASHVVDASRDDPVARVQAIAGGGGVDYAFEVVGTQRTIEQALLSTHRGGMAVVIGISPAGTRLSIDPMLLVQQRILTGSSFGAGHQRTDVPMLIDLFMDGTYKLRELISRRIAARRDQPRLRPPAAGQGQAQRDRLRLTARPPPLDGSTKAETEGRVFLTATLIRGRFALRACILHYGTSEADIGVLVATVREVGARLAA